MAKKRKQKNIVKWVVRGFLLVLLIAAGVIVYLVWDNYFNDKKDEPKPAESSETTEVADEKDEKKSEEGESAETELVNKEVKQYEGENPNSAEGLTGVITHAGVSGANLVIRVNIDQYLESGTCTLGLRKEGMNLYGAEARIVPSASTATCEGFDVPVSELESGNIRIVVYISSGGKTGEINGEVSI